MFTENNFDSAISTQSNEVATQPLRNPIFEPHDNFLGCEWGYVQNLDMPLYAEINGSKVYFKSLEKVYLAIFESKKEQHPELYKLTKTKNILDGYVFCLCETNDRKLGVIAFANKTTKEQNCIYNFDLSNKSNDDYIFISWNGKYFDLRFPRDKFCQQTKFENMLIVVEVCLNHYI